MSNSTLDDFYRGMKMPNYDGKNIYQQMRSLNGQTTLTAQIHEEHATLDQHMSVSQANSRQGTTQKQTHLDSSLKASARFDQSFGR